MTPVGQVYRPEGRIDARSILSATILGVVTAFLAAIVIWAWELSPIPTLVLLTPLAQGLVIGGVLAWLIGRLKLRHPKLMAAVGLACGLASVGLIHYAHYLHFLDEVGRQARAMVEASDEIPAAKKQEILAELAAGKGAVGDEVLADRTGRTGFLGSLIFRAQQGVRIKNAELTGWGVYILWACEAGAVAAVAAAMASRRAAMPFCEDCGTWCSRAMSPVVLGGEAAGDFTDSLRTDDAQRAARLIGQPADTDALELHRLRAILHSCDGCEQTFADVEAHQTKIKKGKPEVTSAMILRKIRLSPAMANLLRGPIAEPGASGAPEDAGGIDPHGDEVAAVESRDP